MKSFLSLTLAVCISITFVSCTKNVSTATTVSQNSASDVEESVSGSEYITDKNRHLIGTEIHENGSTVQQNNNENLIPYKNIVNAIDEKMVLTPSSINDFAVKEDNNNYYLTPEIITTNGSVSLFTKEDGSGWKLDKGNTLTFNFNKYDSKSKNIVIGYVLNGKLINGEKFTDLSGNYKIIADEPGEYYIYIVNVSSDYIAFKEGNITLS